MLGNLLDLENLQKLEKTLEKHLPKFYCLLQFLVQFVSQQSIGASFAINRGTAQESTNLADQQYENLTRQFPCWALFWPIFFRNCSWALRTKLWTSKTC